MYIALTRIPRSLTAAQAPPRGLSVRPLNRGHPPKQTTDSESLAEDAGPIVVELQLIESIIFMY